MKTKTFTSEKVAEWLVTFYRFSTKEEYNNQLHAIRCMFDAEGDPEFFDEVCEKAKEMLDKK